MVEAIVFLLAADVTLSTSKMKLLPFMHRCYKQIRIFILLIEQSLLIEIASVLYEMNSRKCSEQKKTQSER